MTSRILIRGGLLVTMNPQREVFSGDILVENNRIARIGKSLSPPKGGPCDHIEAQDAYVIPGLVQAHTHLCQALFRGQADDLALLDWLERKIWPMESAHNKSSLTASARIGLLEMQLAGTTSILDMGTVRHTDVLLETAQESGIRYWGGKCLMDLKATSGPLWEEKHAALKETEEHLNFFAKNRRELMNYALCPRFAVSCSDDLLRSMLGYQADHDVLIHTHASESQAEIALIRKRTGLDNIDYLDELGLLGQKTIIVHGVHLSAGELKKMVHTQTPLVHCPSSNLKLGSGTAPIESYRKEGLTVALGSDGAPCNNSMDPFIEMRLAALIQKPNFGPQALPAQSAFEMATLGGARALNIADRIGSLEVGKLADIVIVDRSHPSVHTVSNPYSALVYSCLGRDVRHVLTHGRVVVKHGEHQVFDQAQVLSEAQAELKKLLRRI